MQTNELYALTDAFWVPHCKQLTTLSVHDSLKSVCWYSAVEKLLIKAVIWLNYNWPLPLPDCLIVIVCFIVFSFIMLSYFVNSKNIFLKATDNGEIQRATFAAKFTASGIHIPLKKSLEIFPLTSCLLT